MIVGIRVEALKPKSGEVTHTNSCYFTMAAKDENGQLRPVPGLILENDREIRRFCEGKIMKEFSRKKREVLKSNLSEHSANSLLKMCEGEKCQVNIN
jgi:acyl-CoA hydrolase